VVTPDVSSPPSPSVGVLVSVDGESVLVSVDGVSVDGVSVDGVSALGVSVVEESLSLGGDIGGESTALDDDVVDVVAGDVVVLVLVAVGAGLVVVVVGGRCVVDGGFGVVGGGLLIVVVGFSMRHTEAGNSTRPGSVSAARPDGLTAHPLNMIPNSSPMTARFVVICIPQRS